MPFLNHAYTTFLFLHPDDNALKKSELLSETIWTRTSHPRPIACSLTTGHIHSTSN